MSSSHQTEPLFEPVDGLFIPSELTRGGWSDHHQHGGPPSGLLAHAIEATPTLTPMRVVRITFDLFRPIPLTPLTIKTTVHREGKRLQLVDAFLYSDDIELMRATALRLRLADPADLPTTGVAGWTPPYSLEETEPLQWEGHHWYTSGLPRFHTTAVEIRTYQSSFRRLGPGFSYFRLKCPLLPGEENSPLVTLSTLADQGNGNSSTLDAREFIYVNPDITMNLVRYSNREWIGMQSEVRTVPEGVGLADSFLFDQDGPIGRITQSQLIDHQHLDLPT